MESISQPISAAPCPASHWCRFTHYLSRLGCTSFPNIFIPLCLSYQPCIKSSLMHMIETPALQWGEALFVLLPVLRTPSFLHVHNHSHLICWCVIYQGQNSTFQNSIKCRSLGLSTSATRAVDFKTAPKLLELYCDKAALAYCHTLVLINSWPVTLLYCCAATYFCSHTLLEILV